jgi:hypothetical protein
MTRYPQTPGRSAAAGSNCPTDDLDRVVEILIEGEGRAGVGQEVKVAIDANPPSKGAGEEILGELGQFAGEQGSEPTDDRDEEGLDGMAPP